MGNCRLWRLRHFQLSVRYDNTIAVLTNRNEQNQTADMIRTVKRALSSAFNETELSKWLDAVCECSLHRQTMLNAIQPIIAETYFAIEHMIAPARVASAWLFPSTVARLKPRKLLAVSMTSTAATARRPTRESFQGDRSFMKA